MPYPELMVAPMRQDLARLGVKELRTAADVDAFVGEKSGTSLLIVNSVCGCAAGAARPAVALAMQHGKQPDRIATVFAGQDTDAVARARSYFPELPPSSPSFIVIKDGQLADYIPRHRIESRNAQTIAADLTAIFDRITA
jgi:putative YphP/YqiW family bacilliredoxin